MSNVFSAYTLPNGQQLKNRLAKAAMEENLAEVGQLPGQSLFRLYDTWAKGGVGLIITGNVMVDHMAMTGPGGIALEADTNITPFKVLAEKGKQNGCKVWMQINHPGRQVFEKLGGKALSPSDIALDMGKHSKLFAQPKAMSEAEIDDVIERFVITAKRAEEAGFDGVEIHAAHGYLLSQFLSPLTNKRKDQWGGTLENRARLLIQVVSRIRAVVSLDFAVAVKLNSADFQRGGFNTDDALAVVKMLEPLKVDTVELSGGSYEAPAMQGQSSDERTLAREAYFLEFAEQIAKATTIPIMTTGGVRRLPVAEQVLNSGVELVGIGSALAFTPDLPNLWQQNPQAQGTIPNVTWKDKTLASLATMAIVKRNIRRMAAGKTPKEKLSPLLSIVQDQLRINTLTKRYRKQYID